MEKIKALRFEYMALARLLTSALVNTEDLPKRINRLSEIKKEIAKLESQDNSK